LIPVITCFLRCQGLGERLIDRIATGVGAGLDSAGHRKVSFTAQQRLLVQSPLGEAYVGAGVDIATDLEIDQEAQIEVLETERVVETARPIGDTVADNLVSGRLNRRAVRFEYRGAVRCAPLHITGDHPEGI